MNDVNVRKQAKEFAEYWKDKGYEKGQSQVFWLTLLKDVSFIYKFSSAVHPVNALAPMFDTVLGIDIPVIKVQL